MPPQSPPKPSAALLEIGLITKPHGLRGELKVHLHFDGSSSLREVKHVTLRSPSGKEQRIGVTALRGTAKEPILCLEGVSGRDQAEALRGHALFVDRTEVAALAPGEYYLVDLVGCDVFLQGQLLGRISAVRPDPSVDTLVIELARGGVAEQPLLPEWVGQVDIAARTVELLSDDGLIE